MTEWVVFGHHPLPTEMTSFDPRRWILKSTTSSNPRKIGSWVEKFKMFNQNARKTCLKAKPDTRKWWVNFPAVENIVQFLIGLNAMNSEGCKWWDSHCLMFFWGKLFRTFRSWMGVQVMEFKGIYACQSPHPNCKIRLYLRIFFYFKDDSILKGRGGYIPLYSDSHEMK